MTQPLLSKISNNTPYCLPRSFPSAALLAQREQNIGCLLLWRELLLVLVRGLLLLLLRGRVDLAIAQRALRVLAAYRLSMSRVGGGGRAGLARLGWLGGERGCQIQAVRSWKWYATDCGVYGELKESVCHACPSKNWLAKQGALPQLLEAQFAMHYHATSQHMDRQFATYR